MGKIEINHPEQAFKALEKYHGSCHFTYKRSTGNVFEKEQHLSLDVDSVEVRYIVKGCVMRDRDKRLRGDALPVRDQEEFDLSEFKSIEIRDDL